MIVTLQAQPRVRSALCATRRCFISQLQTLRRIRADAIGAAARSEDGAAVLLATANTLQACTGCHARFRQEVVSAATWQARTGEAHDPAMRHATH